MLILKNIEKNSKIIYAEYESENSGEIGAITIDIKTKKVIQETRTKFDEKFPIYLSHAIYAMKKMIEETSIPSEKIVMWY